MNPHIQTLQNNIAPIRQRIIEHDLYQHITSKEAVQIFMQNHVYAVWDFMSLLKQLQQQLTCVTTPWVPVGSPSTRKLINEIVIAEETDEDENGNPASHFELYLDAMQQAGATTFPIESFVSFLRNGTSLKEALNKEGISKQVKTFVEHTFSIISQNKPHVTAAAFTFGREDLIPDLFGELVKDIDKKNPGQLSKYVYYLERHIELDGDEHGPMAFKMLEELCGSDEQKWAECEEVSKATLNMRLNLWNGILTDIKANNLITT